MKPHPFLFSIFILGAATLHAQTQTPIQPATPTQEKKANSRAEAAAPAPEFTSITPVTNVENPAVVSMDRDGSVLLSLKQGTVQEIVKQLETIAHEMVNKGCDDWAQVPNIVYGPGAQEAEVPTIMRLRQVNPVQALALVSAAAGCTLQPISAPVENAGHGEAAPPADAEPRIIGYRIEMADKLVPATRNPNLSLVAPHRAVPEYRVMKTQYAEAPVVVGVNPAGPFVLDVAAAQTTPTSASRPEPENSITPAVMLGGQVQPAAAKANEPSVRVYAVGAYMRGSPEEMKEKQVQLEVLIHSGLDLASVQGNGGPSMSFHAGTKTLIVKATAAQHDIISQIVTALKENEAAGSAAKP
jgi:hypothetical protein